MKKFYEEFFYVPKHGKVKEKVMLTRIGVSVAFMVLCMVAMSLSAYAYFSSNTTAYVQPIQSANYQLSVTPSDIPQSSDNVYTLPSGTHKFDIFKTDADTASTGFCEIRVYPDPVNAENYVSFYTEPIGTYLKDGEWETVEKREIQIIVPYGKSVDVWFIAQWGTLSDTLTAIEGETVDLNTLPYFADLDSSDSGEKSEPPANPSDLETNSGSSMDTVPGTPVDTPSDSSSDTSSEIPSTTDSPAQLPSSTETSSNDTTDEETTDTSSQTVSSESETGATENTSEVSDSSQQTSDTSESSDGE